MLVEIRQAENNNLLFGALDMLVIIFMKQPYEKNNLCIPQDSL